MKSKLILGLVACACASACTVVVPGKPDGGETMIVGIPIHLDALPPPKPLQASVLVVANLERSSANLADRYGQIMLALGTFLQGVGLQVENTGVIATYGDHWGPRLLMGRRADTTPTPQLAEILAAAIGSGANVQDYDHLLPIIGSTLGNISDEDVPLALRLLSSSGNFDGDGETSEAKNLIEFGRGLNGEALSPIQGGIERDALFDRPRDLFIVVYLQPLPRRCAMDNAACLVDGRKPTDIFLETDANGDAAWLNFAGPGIKPGRVLHVAIATSENENLTQFRARCAEVPGFPLNLFDVMAPSPNLYFRPLADTMNAAQRGTGTFADFCELIGDHPDAAIMRLGTSVAGVLGGH